MNLIEELEAASVAATPPMSGLLRRAIDELTAQDVTIGNLEALCHELKDRIKGQILELLQALYDTEGMRQTATGAPAILLDDAVCAVEEAIDAMREGGEG